MSPMTLPPPLPRRPGRRAAVRGLTACLAALAFVGCGRRDLHPVSGTVRFPDGSPLTTGRVVLDYGIGSKYGGWGYIKPDGSFTLGSLTQTDGIRAGTVKVAITFAYAGEGDSGSEGTFTKFKPLVHPRFENPETSGLSFEIPRQTKWEIVVERP
jgi:hypothetical protein